MSFFGNFDPLRTLHFLAKDLQHQLQVLLPEETTVQQVVRNMHYALKRVPPDVASTVHLQQAYDLLPPGKDNLNLDFEKPKKSRPIICETSTQTPPITFVEDQEKLKMLQNILKCEESCKQMENLCMELKNEKDYLMKQLDSERENVTQLRIRIHDLEIENNDILLPRIKALQEEKRKLEANFAETAKNLESEALATTSDLKAQLAEAKNSKMLVDQECVKLKHQVKLSGLEGEKFVAILSVRDKQINEIRNDMTQLQEVVNEQLLELHNSAFKSRIDGNHDAISDRLSPLRPRYSKPSTAREEIDKSPIYISPFVTISRGKDSARKEFKQRQITGGTYFPNASCSRASLSRTSPQAAAEYFTKKLDDEIFRIEGICNSWEAYRSDNDLPEEAQDMINTVLGQYNLLISKKSLQFRSLIEECRSCQYKENAITCQDLHGYWDTAYLQVKDLDKQLANLERLKERNWKEVLPETKIMESRLYVKTVEMANDKIDSVEEPVLRTLLFFRKAGDEAKEFPLYRDETTFRSSAEVDERFKIQDERLLDTHCIISIDDVGLATLVNNGLSETVTVNGIPVSEIVTLRNNDNIQILHKLFQYVCNKDISEKVSKIPGQSRIRNLLPNKKYGNSLHMSNQHSSCKLHDASNSSNTPPTGIKRYRESSIGLDKVDIEKEIDTPKMLRNAKSPRIGLDSLKGVRHLMAISKVSKRPKNDLTKPKVMKQNKSPRNDLSDKKGVKRLMSTPRPPKSPTNIIYIANVKGIKRLMASQKIHQSPKNDLSDVKGVKKLFSSPRLPKSPMNDLSDPKGVKRLVATPKIQKPPKNDLCDVDGVKELFSSTCQPKLVMNDLSDLDEEEHGHKNTRSHRKKEPEVTPDICDIDKIPETGIKKSKKLRFEVSDLSVCLPARTRSEQKKITCNMNLHV